MAALIAHLLAMPVWVALAAVFALPALESAVSGAVAWGTLVVLAGYLAGASWRSVAHLIGTAGTGVTAAEFLLVAGAAVVQDRRRARRSV